MDEELKKYFNLYHEKNRELIKQIGDNHLLRIEIEQLKEKVESLKLSCEIAEQKVVDLECLSSIDLQRLEAEECID